MDARYFLLISALLLNSCNSNQPSTEQSVRAFLTTVAADLNKEGASAWRRHFSDTPAFFMASAGHMEFADSAAATAGIQKVAASFPRLELQWGDPLRIDPLTPVFAIVAAPFHEFLFDSAGARTEFSGYFTATAERRDGRWQFRNAHWSLAPARQ